MITLFLQVSSNSFMAILPFALMFLVLYFFMIRPQMNRQKKEKFFQENLKRGDKVVTTSGMHGKVSDITPDGIILETLSGKIKFERSCISAEYTFLRFPENKPS